MVTFRNNNNGRRNNFRRNDSCNGWTFWHYNLNGSTVLIDNLRQKFFAQK